MFVHTVGISSHTRKGFWLGELGAGEGGLRWKFSFFGGLKRSHIQTWAGKSLKTLAQYESVMHFLKQLFQTSVVKIFAP